MDDLPVKPQQSAGGRIGDVGMALLRALRSLFSASILWHLAWPPLVALVLWSVLAFLGWGAAYDALYEAMAGWSWVESALLRWEVAGALAVLVKIVLGVALLPLVYATTLFIVAVFTLPMMLKVVARRDYPDVSARQGGTFAGGLWNTLVAVICFVPAALLTLPLLFVPGLYIIAQGLLAAWVNQRAFRYDALAEHADREELDTLGRSERGRFFAVGLAGALLTYVPFVNFLAPSLTALMFIHYALIALRRQRFPERQP